MINAGLSETYQQLMSGCESRGIPYALCGGLAMAVHGYIRATLDVDILLREDDLPALRELTKDLGFFYENTPMILDKGRVNLIRFVKFPQGQGQAVILDVLLVTEGMREIWQQQQEIVTGAGKVRVIRPEGLIAMKRQRGSAVDASDIAWLETLIKQDEPAA